MTPGLRGAYTPTRMGHPKVTENGRIHRYRGARNTQTNRPVARVL